MFSISDLIHRSAPHLPAELPGSHIAAAHSIAAHFPAGLTRCLMFEYHLDSAHLGADFLFSITRPERDALLRDDALRRWLPAHAQSPLWQRIANFAQTWAQPSSELHHRVLNLWLEFDVAERRLDADGPLLAPGFFFGTKDLPASAGWLFDLALPLLSGSRLTPAAEATFRRCLDCLPAGGHVYQIGGFYERRPPCVRACVTGIPPLEIPAYLRAIGAPAGDAALEYALRELAPLAQIHLDVDILEGVGPKIGLECALDQQGLLHLAGHEWALLNCLRQHGWLRVDQQRALMQYPGFAVASPSPAFPGAQPPAGLVPTVRRDLSHVKLVFQPGHPVRVKAYLQAVHDWMTPRDAMRHSLLYQARQNEAGRLINEISREAGPESPSQRK